MDLDNLSLEELQQQFQQVQIEDNAFRLSERNVVELVNYLMSSGRLKDVMFTTDGKEYITEKQIRKEIEESITHSGGRINRSDLQALLKVDFSHIERITNKIISESNQTISLVHGDLITTEYLDSVCREVDENLQESGSIDLGDIIKRLTLPNDFITKAVSSRIGSIIKGRLEDSTLYTESYVMREKARLRGTTSAYTRPTPVAQLRQDLQDSLFDPLLKDLAREKRLFGNLHKALYVPKAFETSIQSTINQFLNQNGYISLDRVDAMLYVTLGPNAAKNYCKNKYPNTIFVNHYCITTWLRDQLDAAVQNCIENETCVNLNRLNIIPPEFTQDDVNAFLSTCSHYKKSNHSNQVPIVFGASYMITVNMINNIVKQMQPDAFQMVKKFATRTRISHHATPAVTTNTNTSNHSVRKSDKKKKKKSGHHDDQDEEDFDSNHDNDDEFEDLICEHLPSRDVIWGHVKKHLGDDAPDDKDFQDDLIISEMIDYLVPLVRDLYKSQKHLVLGAMDSMNSIQDFEIVLQKMVLILNLNKKALKTIPNDLESILSRKVVSDKCLFVVYVICRQVVRKEQLEIDFSSTDLKLSTVVDVSQIAPELHSKMVQTAKLVSAKDVKKSLSDLIQSLNKSLDEFLIQLEKSAITLNLFLKVVDKKRERQCITDVKDEIEKSVVHEIDPQKLLTDLCCYLVLNENQILLPLYFEYLPQVVPWIISNLSLDVEFSNELTKVCDLVKEHNTSSDTMTLENKTRMEKLLTNVKSKIIKN
ncbi:E3 UFM1-protein ligase [Acrasis kona]|uniref:E3 UFM1-protein ligase n=1 Tax=Acrasis kona TaxID=1008807 RepID=A0AAW2ZGT8_9EUKA